LEAESVLISSLDRHWRNYAEATSQAHKGTFHAIIMFTVQGQLERRRFIVFPNGQYSDLKNVAAAQKNEGNKTEWVKKINDESANLLIQRASYSSAKKERNFGNGCENCKKVEPFGGVFKFCGGKQISPLPPSSSHPEQSSTPHIIV
jgi:hypothetical protein